MNQKTRAALEALGYGPLSPALSPEFSTWVQTPRGWWLTGQGDAAWDRCLLDAKKNAERLMGRMVAAIGRVEICPGDDLAMSCKWVAFRANRDPDNLGYVAQADSPHGAVFDLWLKTCCAVMQ